LLFLFYQHQLEVAATRELSWLNMGNWAYDLICVTFHSSTKC
jgi:hypothetical protein